MTSSTNPGLRPLTLSDLLKSDADRTDTSSLTAHADHLHRHRRRVGRDHHLPNCDGDPNARHGRRRAGNYDHDDAERRAGDLDVRTQLHVSLCTRHDSPNDAPSPPYDTPSPPSMLTPRPRVTAMYTTTGMAGDGGDLEGFFPVNGALGNVRTWTGWSGSVCMAILVGALLIA